MPQASFSSVMAEREPEDINLAERGALYNPTDTALHLP